MDNNKREVQMELLLHHFKHCIKTELRQSPIDGVGIFAIKNIGVGEEVFPQWQYETGLYIIENKRFGEGEEILEAYTENIIL